MTLSWVYGNGRGDRDLEVVSSAQRQLEQGKTSRRESTRRRKLIYRGESELQGTGTNSGLRLSPPDDLMLARNNWTQLLMDYGYLVRLGTVDSRLYASRRIFDFLRRGSSLVSQSLGWISTDDINAHQKVDSWNAHLSKTFSVLSTS